MLYPNSILLGLELLRPEPCPPAAAAAAAALPPGPGQNASAACAPQPGIEARRIHIVTFGGSRIGNGPWAAWVNGLGWGSLVRVVHGRDPVPHLPPPPLSGPRLYFHAGRELFVPEAGDEAPGAGGPRWCADGLGMPAPLPSAAAAGRFAPTDGEALEDLGGCSSGGLGRWPSVVLGRALAGGGDHRAYMGVPMGGQHRIC